MSKLIVKSNPNTGLVINVSEKTPNWGSVMVAEDSFVINGGIINKQTRTAFFRAELATLNAMNLAAGSEFPIEGKLIHREATAPFYKGQKPKTQGKDGGVLLYNGIPIYRETVFTSEIAEVDLLIKHTSVAPVAVSSQQPLNS